MAIIVVSQKQKEVLFLGNSVSESILSGEKRRFWMTEVKTKGKDAFLMSPKVDFCFKELMRNSEVRRGFLAAVLNIAPEEIEETTLLPTHLEVDYADDKLGILDVKVGMRDGTKVDIEVNIAPFSAWPERSLFYLAKMYIGQIEKGDPYTVLKKCVHIGILDFVLFPGEEGYYSQFHLWEDQRKLKYSDRLEIHICELPKLKKYPHPETELLNWMRFINAEKEEEMEKMAERNKYIQTAYDDLKLLSADERKRQAYEERLKAERDYISFAYDNWERGRKDGLREGRKEGLQEGRREGMEQGKAVEAIQLILRMSEQGCALEKIAKWTGKEMALIRSILDFQEAHPECTAEKIAENFLNQNRQETADAGSIREIKEVI